MEYKDISKEIAEVSQGYNFHKPPDVLVSLQEVMGRLWRWILDWLDTIFHLRLKGASDSRSMSDLMQMGVYLAGVIGICVLIYFLYRRLNQQSEAARNLKKGATDIEEILDAAGWKTQAAKLASNQDHKGACRALYLSLLQCMHEAGVAEFAPTKTNYEYAYALAGNPVIQKAFKDVANNVEMIWFGNKEASVVDYDGILNSVQSIEPEVQLAGAKRKQLEQVI